MQDVVSTTISGSGSSDIGKYIMHIYCIYIV